MIQVIEDKEKTMSSKQTIEIDFLEITKEVNRFFVSTAADILKKSIDLDDLSEKTKKVLKGSIMSEPQIIKIIADQCDWSVSNAFRVAFESTGFIESVQRLTNELLQDKEFNDQLKEQIKLSLLKRI